MLKIFERSKICDWEIQLLRIVLKQLPVEFRYLEKQINMGLFKGIKNDPNVPYRRRFLYDMKIFEAFKIEKEPSYKISGIKVYDKKSKAQLLYTMYISNGVIGGYSIKGADKFSIDVDRTDIFWFVQIFQEVPNSGH
jgi:hypothetical protein